ncbi:MAG: rod shape-determining protein MreC [Hyphomicrobiaceae bacterium]
MPRIVHDPYLTRGARRQARAGSGAALVLLLLVSTLLVVLSRLDHPVTRVLRATVTDAVSPFAAWGTRRLAPIQALLARFDDIAELRSALAREQAIVASLRAAEWQAAEATRKLAEIERLARTVPTHGLAWHSARVVTEANGPFARALVIDAGGEHGLRTGHPVVSADGLVGRIVDVGARASRVLLVTDITSRIPVVIGPRRLRALAVGDNSGRLAIAYTDRDATIAEGDMVVTSGVGGHLPSGIRIGRVERDDGTLAIAPFGALDRLEYVSVLIVDPIGEELGTAERDDARRRVGTAGRAG